MDYGKMDDGSGDVSMKLDKLKELKNKIYELMASGQSGDAIMEEVQEAVNGEAQESPSKEKVEPEHDMASMGEDDPMAKLQEMKKAYFKPKAAPSRPGTGSFIAAASEKMPSKSSGKPKFGGKMGK